MRIITAVFDYPGRDTYARCLRAFRASIAATNPDADLRVIELQPPVPIDGVYQGWINNHIKLEAYSKIAIDQPTVFVDADTVFLRDVSELFDSGFDIAIGRRPNWGGKRVKYNGGVVLFRPTKAARTFMEEWIEIDSRMLSDQDFHMLWHKKYNGQNQSSFGCMVETHLRDVRLREYPTGMVNACEQDWPKIDTVVPYILHVRKRLLRAAQSGLAISQIRAPLQKAVKIWRSYEQCDQ